MGKRLSHANDEANRHQAERNEMASKLLHTQAALTIAHSELRMARADLAAHQRAAAASGSAQFELLKPALFALVARLGGRATITPDDINATDGRPFTVDHDPATNSVTFTLGPSLDDVLADDPQGPM